MQLKRKEITFTISSNLHGPVVQRTLTSLSKNISQYGHICNLLILDKSPDSSITNWLGQEISVNRTFSKVLQMDITSIHGLEKDNIEYLQRASVKIDIDSIQRTRIQMLLAIRHFSNEIANSIIWQLDDDMVFEYQDEGMIFPDVIEKVLRFHNEYPTVDAATGTGFHTPPLPVLLYAEKNLKDLLSGKPLPDRGVSTSPFYYHDLYPELEIEEISQMVKWSRYEFENLFTLILSGDPLFRPIPDLFFEPEKSWHRGGNFIFFNLKAAIAMPHLAVHFRSLISRRSDMIHARLLHDAGFALARIPLGLHHFRDTHLTPDLPKLKLEYLRDALGAIAVRYLENEQSAFYRLADHIAHIHRLILLANDIKSSYQFPLLQDFLSTLNEILTELTTWKSEDLKASLIELKNNYNSLLNSFQNA